MKTCVVCGKTFAAPPSSKKVTCSRECSSINKSRAHTGAKHSWSDTARDKLRQNLQPSQLDNLRLGTGAAQQNPENQRGPQNRVAMRWVLRDPSGRLHHVTNLLDWARTHADDYFDMPSTDKSGRAIASGFWQIKRSMEGRLRRKDGRPYSVYTYKGWTLVSWE